MTIRTRRPLDFGEAVESLFASRHEDQIPRSSLARAKLFAAPAATGMAPNAILTRQKRSQSWRKCDCIGAIARSKARGLPWRNVKPSRRSPVSSSRSPPTPVPPDPDTAAALSEQARKQLDVARKLIAECGYHRRDEGAQAELDAVTAGRSAPSPISRRASESRPGPRPPRSSSIRPRRHAHAAAGRGLRRGHP